MCKISEFYPLLGPFFKKTAALFGPTRKSFKKIAIKLDQK